MRTCIAPWCIAARKPQHLMCPACWAQVPQPVQRRVYAAWTPGSIRQSPEWTAAVDAALACLRKEEIHV